LSQVKPAAGTDVFLIGIAESGVVQDQTHAGAICL